jgi:NAD(P)-dependent dehydrogenase (short-subunit alcohol dehydrogenase family)
LLAGPSDAKAERLAASIRGSGGEARGFGLDALSAAEIAEVTGAVADALGGIDVMVNCVGIQREQSILEVTEETFDEM